MHKGLFTKLVIAAALSVAAGAGAAALTAPAAAQDLAAQPAGTLNPFYPFGSYGYGYGYGAPDKTLIGLAFWTGKPYTYWACQLGVEFQCPSSPNYAYRAAAPVAYAPAAEARPLRHKHKPRHRY